CRPARGGEPQHLSVVDAGRYRHIEPFLGGNREALLAAGRCLDEVNGQGEEPIAAAGREGLTPPPPTSPAGAERGEQVLEITQIHFAFLLVFPTLGTLGVTAIIRAWRPLGAAFVDLAAVVARPLVRIREEVVSA